MISRMARTRLENVKRTSCLKQYSSSFFDFLAPQNRRHAEHVYSEVINYVLDRGGTITQRTDDIRHRLNLLFTCLLLASLDISADERCFFSFKLHETLHYNPIDIGGPWL